MLFWAMVFGFSVVGVKSFSIPIADFKDAQRESFGSSFSVDFDFEGIVKLDNCSGSLVRLESSKSTDKALVLTNGHCLEGGFLKPNQVVVEKPVYRQITMLNSDSSTAGSVRASHIVYATLTKTDMALYRLDRPYDEIESKYEITALTLSPYQADVSTPIEIISGYWKRGYRCAIEEIVHSLKEATWTFSQSMRYSQPGCEIIGGTSGSPILNASTREVIGVNNTTNESGERCTLNNPCEVDEDGNVSYEKGLSYGQQTYWLYSCLTADNKLDLNLAGCQLPK